MEFINPRISGSANISGTLLVNNGITGSLLGTASYSDRSLTSSIAYTSSISITSSFTLTSSISFTSSFTETASYSSTSSFALIANTVISSSAFPYSGSALITGSLRIQDSGDPYFFLISSASMNAFQINAQGVVQFATLSYTPTAVPGGMYFDNSGNFYVGL